MNRRNGMRSLVASLVLAALASPALADTVTGEVVDLACYLGHEDREKMRGPGHRKCADTCLKKGMPIGILTEDKQIWLALENHDNPKPYNELKGKAAETVTVEGKKMTFGGNQGIVIESVK